MVHKVTLLVNIFAGSKKSPGKDLNVIVRLLLKEKVSLENFQYALCSISVPSVVQQIQRGE